MTVLLLRKSANWDELPNSTPSRLSPLELIPPLNCRNQGAVSWIWLRVEAVTIVVPLRTQGVDGVEIEDPTEVGFLQTCSRLVQARTILDKRLVVSVLLRAAGQQSQDVVCCRVVLKRGVDKEEQEGTREGAAFLCLAKDVKRESYLHVMTY
jgi:hypothetical protein